VSYKFFNGKQIKMRWLKEIFNRKLKCKRLGHKFITYDKKIRKKTHEWGRVAEEYKCKIDVCARCDLEKEPYNLEFLRGIQSLTMNTSMFDEMREKGYLIIS
jgi:hypothetical protein